MYEPRPDGKTDSEQKSSLNPEIIVHQNNKEVWVVAAEQHGVNVKLESEDPKVAEQIRERQKSATNESSAFTLRKTTEQPDWSNHIWVFVQDYLINDQVGQQILKEAKVADLQELTQAQAIYISTALVSALKVYDQQHIIDQPNVDLLVMKGHLGHSSYGPDNMTALELLQLGRRLKKNGVGQPPVQADVTGNGVCRNFADTVYAVFEALKTHQHPTNYLRHTYCLRESGDETYFEPKHQELDASTLLISRPGHAWNRFITIEQSREIQTVVDSTWSRIDGTTGQLTQYDYSFKRSFKPLLESLRGELLTTPDTERKKQIFGDMFALTAKAIESVNLSEVVMDDELSARLQPLPKFQELVAELQQKRQLNLADATSTARELYRQAMTKAQEEPQAAFYVHSLMIEVYRNQELLTTEQKQKLRTWILEHFPRDTGISLEVLLKTGASPQQLQERMVDFIPRAAEDHITRSLVLPNPWLQVWIYGLGNENTFQQLEKSDSFSNYGVWYLRPAVSREHQPGESFYANANEFWYDLWRALVKRSDPTSTGEARLVSYPSDTLKLWLDIIAHIWNQESARRYKNFTSPRRPINMNQESLKKKFTFEETKQLLAAFITEAQVGLDEDKQSELTFFSGDKRQVTDSMLSKVTQLQRVLDKASTTTSRMETF